MSNEKLKIVNTKNIIQPVKMINTNKLVKTIIGHKFTMNKSLTADQLQKIIDKQVELKKIKYKFSVNAHYQNIKWLSYSKVRFGDDNNVPSYNDSATLNKNDLIDEFILYEIIPAYENEEKDEENEESEEEDYDINLNKK
jgi:hypothetical protein